jgi:hypothetical protein
MTRMRVTIVGYYVTDQGDYGGETDPQKMAAIDQANVEGDDPYFACGLIDSALPLTVKVEPDA